MAYSQMVHFPMVGSKNRDIQGEQTDGQTMANTIVPLSHFVRAGFPLSHFMRAGDKKKLTFYTNIGTNTLCYCVKFQQENLASNWQTREFCPTSSGVAVSCGYDICFAE